jgi:hypothetical protein
VIWAVFIVTVLIQSTAKVDFVAFNGSEIAPTISKTHVAEDGVHIQLEVFVGDLETFDALVPDNWFKDDASARATPAERLADFAETGISIRRSDGTALPDSVELVERRMREILIGG